ncbi:MAG: ester cyclase [Candidatus Aminicenantes bacterium]|nr:MAG: ester cyclase [Candidatus Aminicenantes bacterium]
MKKLSMILPMALILCFIVGCQDKEAMAELEEFRAQAELEEQNKGLVKRMYEAFEKGDFEAYKEVVAPEYAWYLPSRSTKPISREETIEFGKMLRNAFPDFAYSIEELIAEDDIVISRFIFTGTHEGEFQGIPATGNKVEMSGFMMTRIENGKIVEDKEEYDGLGFMQQLGMELKPKEVKK